MHLRRASNKRKISSELKTKHVRRRIDETKASIKIERVAAEAGLKSLLQDNLEDVACPNVFLGLFYRALELFRMNIAVSGLYFAIGRWNRRKIGRFREPANDGMDRFSRSRIKCFEWAIIEECVRDDLQRA